MVSFPLFSLVFRACCCSDKIKTESSGLRLQEPESLYFCLSFHESRRLVLRTCSPFVIRDRQRNVLFSFPFLCCCCATLD